MAHGGAGKQLHVEFFGCESSSEALRVTQVCNQAKRPRFTAIFPSEARSAQGAAFQMGITLPVSSWLLPHLHPGPGTCTDEAAADGIPHKYYNAGSDAQRAGGDSPRARAFNSMTSLFFAACSAALAARADLIGILWLTLHSAGLAPVALLEMAHGHAPLLTFAYVAISFCGAAFGYYRHCSAIEAWCDAQPAGSAEQWKVQPQAIASQSSRTLSRRLGTFNAGCAAVYGTASTLAALHGGFGIKLYFSISEIGRAHV